MTDSMLHVVSRWLAAGSSDRLTHAKVSFGLRALDGRQGWLWAASAAIAVGCVWYYFRWQPRRRRLAVLGLALCRASLLATALLIVTEPGLWAEIEEPAPAAVWLIFDGSDSLSSFDRPELLSRLQSRFQVESFLIEQQGNLTPIGTPPNSATNVPPRAEKPAARSPTRLRTALAEVAWQSAGESLAGIILFSDFNSITDPPPAEATRQLGVPVYTVGLGPLTVAEQDPKQAMPDGGENGMNSVLRVLVIEYEPTWEWRYLKETFLRDPRIGPKGFRTFLRSADPQVRGRDPLFYSELPRDRDELQSHDVVVLGDLPAAALGSRFCEQLREFVERFGGGLVILSGTHFGPAQLADTPLAELLPVTLDDVPRSEKSSFLPRLTAAAAETDFMRLSPDAERNTAAWQKLGPLDWYQPTRAVHPQTTVLLEHPTAKCSDARTPQPLVALRRAGRGEVLYLAMNESWRLRRPAGPRDYRRFWTAAIHRLGANHTASEASTTETAVNAGRTADALDAQRNHALEQELARVTGGKAYELDEIDHVLDELWPSDRWQSAFQIIPLWNNWPVFVWVVGLMLAEWWGRKRLSLP
ncbi:MAG TPA: hypothetical protein VJ783_32165 [Pirellulales bacterium]|nr:hypothetical protein [Pirellulales bacterium]